MAKEKFVVEETNPSNFEEDDFEYKELPLSDEDDEDLDHDELEVDDDPEGKIGVEEDLDTALRTLEAVKEEEEVEKEREGDEDPLPEAKVEEKQVVVEDFIRNFLQTHNMTRTSNAFEDEWLQVKESLIKQSPPVPDVYQENLHLSSEVSSLSKKVQDAKQQAKEAIQNAKKIKSERDQLRMKHRQVVQEKKKLLNDLKRMEKHVAKYEPVLHELQRKYESATREKTLIRLERDKLMARMNYQEDEPNEDTQYSSTHSEDQHRYSNDSSTYSFKKKKSTSQKPCVKTSSEKDQRTTENSKFGRNLTGTVDLRKMGDRPNPYLEMQLDKVDVSSLKQESSIIAHPTSVASIDIHPSQPFIATASDDSTWKLYTRTGELVMTGEGHQGWLSCCQFHPSGRLLATGGADTIVRIWEFGSASCVNNLTEHTKAVWSVAYHDTGDVIASGSMDHTARLWDPAVGKCLHTLRGHVDSVNHVVWQPYSHVLATVSGDKTVSLWDVRSPRCMHTFYGHVNAGNHACFSLRGDTLVSCDTDGVTKVWDLRTAAEAAHIDAGPYGANAVALDPVASTLFVASDETEVKVYEMEGEYREIGKLLGHEDAVQDIALSDSGDPVVTCGSEGMVRLWTGSTSE
eukprot:gb/GECH01014316.1/.p1 GENE.gb/GECH01014316.1/~~gb/GECH01014316.1/.p1  ORF type:complete len:629 (+),score=204.68 gb/GECH01014316.1/:1-1887(+)